jgi:hypothetical protein
MRLSRRLHPFNSEESIFELKIDGHSDGLRHRRGREVSKLPTSDLREDLGRACGLTLRRLIEALTVPIPIGASSTISG